MEQAHRTGELYWRGGDACAQLSDPEDRLTRLQEHRVELRDAFDPLMRCVRVIVLEGPAPVAEAAEAVQSAALEANRALWRVTTGVAEAHQNFTDAHGVFRRRLKRFTVAARDAMTAS
jgi:hypothetical protein